MVPLRYTNTNAHEKNKVKTRPVNNYPPEREGEEYTLDELAVIRYSVRIWLLEEIAGLDYMEASMLLLHEWPDSLKDFDLKWKLTMEQKEKLLKSATEKYEAASKEKDVFMGYNRFSEETIYDKYKKKLDLSKYYKGP